MDENVFVRYVPKIKIRDSLVRYRAFISNGYMARPYIVYIGEGGGAEPDNTTSVLGRAILGKMILGKGGV